MILHVIRAEHRGGHRVHLWFSDDSEGEIDFQPLLDGPIFEPLKNVDYFKGFRIEGHTLAWDNGADFAPEYLHDLIQWKAMVRYSLPSTTPGGTEMDQVRELKDLLLQQGIHDVRVNAVTTAEGLIIHFVVHGTSPEERARGNYSDLAAIISMASNREELFARFESAHLMWPSPSQSKP